MPTLGETLLEPPHWPGSKQDDNDSAQVGLYQHLVDSVAIRQFSFKNIPARSALSEEPTALKFEQSERESIIEHEKTRWTSIFETLKWGGGIYAAYRWAPQFMPPATAVDGLLTWKRQSGVDYIVFGGPTRSEILKQMKARYTVTCMGGMAAGWAASHVADQLCFARDQYMECAVAGDLAGIGLALVVPGWRQKAASVAASHLIGRAVDHWRQPQYSAKSGRY